MVSLLLSNPQGTRREDAKIYAEGREKFTAPGNLPAQSQPQVQPEVQPGHHDPRHTAETGPANCARDYGRRHTAYWNVTRSSHLQRTYNRAKIARSLWLN